MAYQNPGNNCVFMGRVVDDPRISYVQMGENNVAKAFFKLAVNRQLTAEKRNNAQQNGTKTCDFVPFSATGKTAEFVEKYCTKGKSFLISCQYTEYTKMNQATGQKEYGHVFEVDAISFCTQDSKNSQQNDNNQNQQYNQQYNNQNQQYNQQMQQQPQMNQQYNNQQPQQNFQQQTQNNSNFSMFDSSNQPF